MKKRVLYQCGALLLFCLVFCGCSGEELLDQVPRDLVVAGREVEAQEREDDSAQEPDGGTDVSGETQAPDTEQSFLCEGAFEYARQSLDEPGQQWYDDMKRTLGCFGAGERLSAQGLQAGYNEADIDRIFQCVLNDHPELFYVEGYSYTKYTRGDHTTAIEFSGTYNVDRDTAEVRAAQIETAVSAILSGIDANADQYTRVKYVYDTIISTTDYRLDAPDNQNIYSVFVNHLSVCQGYAKATQYLLGRLGVECTLVLGSVETGEGHAWNLVRVDGSYYYVDTTWGDASYRMEDSGRDGGISMPEINYDYLNVTTAELLKTHSLGDGVPMPACIATEANYYSREGALFAAYDREQMKALFAKAREQGRDDVTVKCTDADSYGQVVSALIDGQEIFDYLGDGGSTVAYAQNENQLSLTFWVTNE